MNNATLHILFSLSIFRMHAQHEALFDFTNSLRLLDQIQLNCGISIQAKRPEDQCTQTMIYDRPLALPSPNHLPNAAILPPLSVFEFGLITPPSAQLSSYNHKGASVLPYIETIDPITQKLKGYVLLGRETKSGLYNDFGGEKDKNENSLETAAREFSEETINLVFDYGTIKKQLTDQTRFIIVYRPYKFVIHLAAFNNAELTNLKQNFYTARNATKSGAYKEKDELALVAWEDLATTIKAAQRSSDGKFKIPILVTASVIKPNGVFDEKIKLRRALVDALYSFVHQHKPNYVAEISNILFYS